MINLLKKKKVDPPTLQPVKRSGGLLPQRPVGGSFGSVTPAFALGQRIESLSRQGMSEPEIVKDLRGQGYSSLEIDKALRDSLKSGVGEPTLPVMERRIEHQRAEREDLRMPEPPMPQRVPSEVLERPASRLQPGERLLGGRPIGSERQIVGRPPPTERAGIRPFPVIDLRKGVPPGRATEELIEVTVEEKWKEAESLIKGTEGKISELEARLKQLEEDIGQLRQMEEKKETEISTKIDTYRDSIQELSQRLEGMETALKSALESVLESNRSLSDAVRGLKEKGRG